MEAQLPAGPPPTIAIFIKTLVPARRLILAERQRGGPMIENTKPAIPETHPIRTVFYELTKRGMSQLHLTDRDTIQYVTNLLIEFVHIKNLYRLRDETGQRLEYVCDILEKASQAMSADVRREYYRHLGDLTLFNLGLFPEALTYGRRTVSPDYYAEQGRRSYTSVAEMERPEAMMIFRKLSDQFEQCVVGLNWVKLYINDPFYQYMFREFRII